MDHVLSCIIPSEKYVIHPAYPWMFGERKEQLHLIKKSESVRVYQGVTSLSDEKNTPQSCVSVLAYLDSSHLPLNEAYLLGNVLSSLVPFGYYDQGKGYRSRFVQQGKNSWAQLHYFAPTFNSTDAQILEERLETVRAESFEHYLRMSSLRAYGEEFRQTGRFRESSTEANDRKAMLLLINAHWLLNQHQTCSHQKAQAVTKMGQDPMIYRCNEYFGKKRYTSNFFVVDLAHYSYAQGYAWLEQEQELITTCSRE